MKNEKRQTPKKNAGQKTLFGGKFVCQKLFLFFFFSFSMKNLLSKKGFTLIELLVVITIIGILATGATTVYTSAQQKARDSIRQTDALSLKSAIEQSYGDNSAYPKADTSCDDSLNPGTPISCLKEILVHGKYLSQLPKDPKTNAKDDDTYFYYVYGAGSDNGIPGQLYEVSANYENKGNADSKEKNTKDKGNDDNRWEIGTGIATVNTNIDDSSPPAADPNDYNGDGTVDDEPVIIDSVT